MHQFIGEHPTSNIKLLVASEKDLQGKKAALKRAIDMASGDVILTTDAGDEGFGSFLKFETLTLCPIDTRCLDTSLMRDDEIAWLNDYHDTVRARLSPRVTGNALEWLHRATQPV